MMLENQEKLDIKRKTIGIALIQMQQEDKINF